MAATTHTELHTPESEGEAVARKVFYVTLAGAVLFVTAAVLIGLV